MKRAAILLSSVSAMGAVASPAQAQEASASSYNTDEIIVTAQKRDERLQDVPLAVSAVSSAQIASRGISNIAQLSQMAPNVNLNEGIVNPTILVPYIRGIGSVDNNPEIDLPVAISIDGVYLASAYGGLVDAFDIQQVEILRGPQGTLQGRNAPGGAVNITTRRPGSKLVTRAKIQYGRFDDLRVSAGIDGPLIEDKVGFKLAALRRKDDGYVKNETTGQRFGGRNTWAIKGGLAVTPSERLNMWFGIDYTKDKSQPTGFRSVNDGIDYPRTETDPQLNTVACASFDICTPNRKYTTTQDFFGNAYITNLGMVSNIDYDAGDVTLTSVTGYRKVRDTYRLDIDATPAPLLHADPTTVRQNTFSQEFRISTNDGGALSFDNHVRALAGVYYARHRFTRFQNVMVFGNDIGDDYAQTLKSSAIFGHIDILPTDKFTISFGGRYMWDKKSFTNEARELLGVRNNFKKFIFDAGANYKISDNDMVYVRFARGYKPGGFNQNGVIFEPEDVDSFEGGIKTQFLDRRVTFNLTGFYYKYDNLQRQSDVFLNGQFLRVTTNVGKQHAYGVEAELSARPVDGLNLNFAVGYLNAKYDRYDVNVGGEIVDNSALPVIMAPKLTLSAGASYEIPVQGSFIGKITPSVNAYHRSSYYTQAAATPVSYDNGYVLLNAALRISDADSRYAVSIFGDNLLNEYYINSGGTLGGLSLYKQDAPPRTYGVRFEVEF